MKTEEKFEKLIKEAKDNISLTGDEKKAGLAKLLLFIKEHPVRDIQQVRHNYITSTFTSFFALRTQRLKYASITSVILLVLGVAGVSVAANNSLPGDVLYPVKTQVNEKVLGFMQFSPKTKAKYDIELAQLRLEEGEKIAENQALDEKTALKIRNLFDQHIKNAKAKSDNEDDLSLEVNLRLEDSLSIHKEIINQIIDGKDDDNAKNLKDILSDVDDNINSANEKIIKRIEMIENKNHNDNGKNGNNLKVDK